MLASRLTLAALASFASLALAGCPQGDSSMDHGDAGGAGGVTGLGGAAGDSLANTPKNALASPCTASSQCGSGYCVDGVCCDSACDGQCLGCALQGAIGHCGPIVQGPDSVGAAPCVGQSSCVLDPVTSLSACKLIDGAACSADSDCGSGHCLTFYVDADGDGYGIATAARFCAELAGTPPAGYAAYPGDCCDIDTGANPGFPSGTYLEFPDACGSFDWNCNGIVATRYSSCPGQANPACGADCVLNLGFVSAKVFTQACN